MDVTSETANDGGGEGFEARLGTDSLHFCFSWYLGTYSTYLVRCCHMPTLSPEYRFRRGGGKSKPLRGDSYPQGRAVTHMAPLLIGPTCLLSEHFHRTTSSAASTA